MLASIAFICHFVRTMPAHSFCSWCAVQFFPAALFRHRRRDEAIEISHCLPRHARATWAKTALSEIQRIILSHVCWPPLKAHSLNQIPTDLGILPDSIKNGKAKATTNGNEAAETRNAQGLALVPGRVKMGVRCGGTADHRCRSGLNETSSPTFAVGRLEPILDILRALCAVCGYWKAVHHRYRR
jgi:hypothetical protein